MPIPYVELFLWSTVAVSIIVAILSKVLISIKKKPRLGLKQPQQPVGPSKSNIAPKANLQPKIVMPDKAILEKEALKEIPVGTEEAALESDASRELKKKRIGDILLERKLITKDILEKALEHQRQTGGSITQYLLHYGYIDEKQLAQCLCSQFKVPYLPLESYDISDEIIKLVPIDIAEKYWLVPIDKQGDSLMVVMIDPLDSKVIRELEEMTGLKVIPFVGIISEISHALRLYYKLFVKDKPSEGVKLPPFFIDTKTYTGVERRHSVRYSTKIDIKFPVQDYYKKSKTINVSRHGLAFESALSMPLGSIITLELSLPSEYSPLPISAIAQVVRCAPQKNQLFEIGVKTLKISKQELGIIIDYAASHYEI